MSDNPVKDRIQTYAQQETENAILGDIRDGINNLNHTLQDYFGTDPLSEFDGTKETYLAVMQKWFQKKIGSPATLTQLVYEWYTVTRKNWHGWVDFPTTGVSTGTKGGDNAGLVCTPSTNTVAGRDDYAGNPLFAVVDCNWSIDATTLEPVITAICGVTAGF